MTVDIPRLYHQPDPGLPRRLGWQATFRAIEYDWERAAQLADAGSRPDWACALRTGYALP